MKGKDKERVEWVGLTSEDPEEEDHDEGVPKEEEIGQPPSD